VFGPGQAVSTKGMSPNQSRNELPDANISRCPVKVPSDMLNTQ